MSMSSAMNASVAGLSANSSRLATISDNIANSSTYGYKRVTTEFDSLVVGSGTGLYTAGGVRSSTQRVVDQDGAIVTSTAALDLAISGRGMLPVTSIADATGTDAPGMMMTRTGSFSPDANGILRSSNGLVLMGWPTTSDGSLGAVSRDTSGSLEPIRIDATTPVGDPTTAVSLGLNLPATATRADGDASVLPLRVEYYGNLGTTEALDIEFTPIQGADNTMTNRWSVSVSDSQSETNPIATFEVTFDDSQANGGSIQTVTSGTGGVYDEATGTIPLTVGGGQIDLFIGNSDSAGGLKQLATGFSPSNIAKDGSPVGKLVNVEMDDQGYLMATYDTGAVKSLYKVPVVDVPNLNGLVAQEGQAFTASPESGAFYLWDSGDGPTGSILGYARESSTTDIAQELTYLITTQRAYSSNAKIIQTVDEMLQETTNIKR
ncbi:flagellar hook-basal body complex protein [Paracoccus sp. 1_MG-2023]|uniref:flagellar hook protein FlgE n=1 Tax=unclassified Paracoccus (in: a-proteobacteria) TaxID=2688777 RepID=UPI001C086BE8|nr:MULTISPECIES: flagellar hook-basal body complex protein [unclassified Paracoccus (in: a-proteobacteria)]MBU2956881.1 flagellar hook-basal body complex protein [Paracoccus sp. C2R09]MDO6668079.1 flagellar hook-basal body complex protein [Paracoccus sp. 1_MG-2023]